MTYRDSDIFRQGASNGASVQLVVPATAQVGDVQVFVVARSGTNTSSDFALAVSEGEAFTQFDPTGSGMGSLGSTSKYAAYVRTTGEELGGGTVTITSGASLAEGRYVSPIVLVSGVDASTLRLAAASPGVGTAYGHPSAIPPAGTPNGTAIFFALGAGANTANTFTFPGDVTAREQASAKDTDVSGVNVWSAVATREFTGDATVAGTTITGSTSTTNKRTLTVLLSAAATPFVTATAPADASVQVGGGAFTLTGTAGAGGGALVQNRLWTRVAGEVVPLANTSSNTVQVTPPASVGGGSTTLRFTVNSGLTPTAFDDVTITWTAASTGPVPYSSGPGWIDARAYGSAVNLSQLSGSPATIAQPTEGVFLLSGSGSFLLSAVDGLGQSVVVSVSGSTIPVGTGPRVELLRHDGTSWSDGLVFVEDPMTSPTLLTSETLTP